jgi:hypothetical protein
VIADYMTKATPKPIHAKGDQDIAPALLAFYSTHP